MKFRLSHSVPRTLAVSLLLSACAAAPLYGQAGCTLNKQVYTCDRAQFRQALASARTAEVEATSTDRMAVAKLRDLVATLGKTVPAPNEPADLVFSLIAVDTAGILVGPSGVDLAVLRVYAPAARTGPETSGASAAQPAHGTLLWAETFKGQPDMSWPATVQATIQQFRASLKHT